MSALFGRFKKTNVLVALATGIVIFITTWLYINSYYTLSVEDDLLSRQTFFLHKLVEHKPAKNKQFVFISTGKDLNLIDDTAGYGNISVSDRYKLYKLLQGINKAQAKPEYILLDLQFYYPYSYSVDDSIQNIIKKSNMPSLFPDKSIDDSLTAEIAKNDKIAISVLLDKNKIQIPLYKSNYGIADYKTYGSFLNKFKVWYPDLNSISIPGLLHREMDGAHYTGNRFATFCNNRLSFNYIWPNYYYDENDVKADTTYQEYHIGSLLPLLNDPVAVKTIFKDKVVFIGNFEDDVHDTPAGKIPGTIVLADIYLSLLNGKHLVPYLWIVFMVVMFSLLSYMAIYNQLPDVKLNFGFAFADQISGFLKQYVSYIGILLLVSVLSVLLFDITISLLLPAFIFSAIDYVIQKKYKKKHEKD
jgi:hypothetical protein